MKRQHDPLKRQIAEIIFKAVQGAYGDLITESAIYDLLMDPPNPQMADYSFGCFFIAKIEKKTPIQVASELLPRFQSAVGFSSVQAAGPYLNFKFSLDLIGEKLMAPILSGVHFQKPELVQKAPKTMIEFSQPNTHKEIHVGHMRNACLGDALVKLHRYCGFDLISSTFPGDVGTHVAKCLWYLKFHNQETIPNSGKGEWLGRIYSKAHLKLEDELGTPQEEKNRESLTEILKQLEMGRGEYYELWKETRQWSVDLMNSVYQWAGIEFDRWYWESEVDAESVQFVNKLFAEGKLVRSEGAIGMNLEEDNLGFCLLLKSDGTGLYATKDLELARRKFQDFKVKKSIYVVDMRQALHFKQVFKVLEKLGFEEAKDCFHLQYNFVELPDGAMSSRKGNIVPLMELVNRMEAHVKSQYLSRYENEWSPEEISKVASQVAQGAIKYGMLRMDTNKKIVFDMNEWLKIDGESGPFVQYSCARIQSLQGKVAVSPEAKLNWNLLAHEGERALVQHLMHFHGIILNSTLNYKPSLVCTYLYELAKKFNYFYHECSIGQAETEDLKLTRMKLSLAVGKVLSQGLALLGIPTPQRM
ncbi:MAG: arginine--tRNA ligase [Proteobacteria bacterium]|nr:arginine--tRNA ligase [Pseudomonadota bacterium]